MTNQKNIAANSVQVMGHGVLILGPSGSGKSDLTLRLLNICSPLLHEPCRLISDDQTMISEQRGVLYASPPSPIAGRLEVRGVGVVNFDYVENIEISLAINLTDHSSIERIPDLSSQKIEYLGVQLPKLDLYPFEVSACEKLVCLVRAITQDALANDI